MVRIAILQVSALLGGADRSLLDLLKAGHKKYFMVTVVVPNKGPLCATLSVLDVPWLTVEQPKALLIQSRSFNVWSMSGLLGLPFFIGQYLLKLRNVLRRISPDVVYTNGIKAHLLSALVKPMLRIPTIWHLREYWESRLAGRLADFAADRIIANSNGTAASIQRYMRDPTKVRVVYNAVDMDQFSPGSQKPNNGPAHQETFRVGLPGAFARIKGHLLFLQAATEILEEFPPVLFYLIGGTIYETFGDRGYERELQEYVHRNGLVDRVIFTGFQREMANWYRTMDVVVNTSLRPEGFGRTLLEAMACGRPVVGPNAGGIPEFLKHGENGLLYEMGNAKGLADCVLTLLRDPVLRRRLGAAGVETARKFTITSYAEAISSVLNEVVQKHQKENWKKPHIN